MKLYLLYDSNAESQVTLSGSIRVRKKLITQIATEENTEPGVSL